MLRGYREQIEAEAAALENPRAVFEYLDFFNDLVTRAINECERIAAGLRQGISPADLDALRQLASNASAEQRRCLMFRDKCINRPLPDERMRPLLNEISVTTRDQLTAFRDLIGIAAKLEEQMQAATAPPPPRGCTEFRPARAVHEILQQRSIADIQRRTRRSPQARSNGSLRAQRLLR